MNHKGFNLNTMITEMENQLQLEINELSAQLNALPMQKRLQDIYFNSLGYLRRQCNLVLPMCSGHYRPDSYLTAFAESFHASTHVILHMVHHQPYLGLSLTFIGQLLTFASIRNEHFLLHEIKEHFDVLTLFSDYQRELIYRFVCLKTLILLTHKINVYAERDWEECIPSYILSSLFMVYSDNIHANDFFYFSKKWVDVIDQIYITTGAIFMQNALDLDLFKKPIEELSIAWQIQQIFEDNAEPTPAQLKLPLITGFIDMLHRRIYTEILKPYEGRAQSSNFASMFFGYNNEQMSQIRLFQKKMIMAFNVLYPHYFTEDTRPLNFLLQLSIINTLFYAATNQAGIQMSWHVTAPRVALELHNDRPNLGCNLRPLVKTDERHVRVLSCEAALMIALENLNRNTHAADAYREACEEMRRMMQQMREELAELRAKQRPAADNDCQNNQEGPKFANR